MEYTLNLHGRLMDLSQPQVMGILNVTPDSFYAGSRVQTERDIAARANQIVAEGGSMIDVGGYSTRPGAMEVSEAEEMERLRFGLDVVRRELPYSVISRLRVPYILMSQQPTIKKMLLSFATQVQQLRDLGVKDIILDPGFGFGKTLEQNYEVMGELEKLLVMELPLLVGISRKSMIYKLFGCTPNESLNGTTALNTIALMKGTSILRVHDVKEAAECVKVFSHLSPLTPNT